MPRRKARRSSVSQKFPEDPIHRDVFAYAHKAKLTLHCDSEGAFTVVHQPTFLDDATIERHITQAGLKAQMSITFAPGLFS